MSTNNKLENEINESCQEFDKLLEKGKRLNGLADLLEAVAKRSESECKDMRCRVLRSILVYNMDEKTIREKLAVCNEKITKSEEPDIKIDVDSLTFLEDLPKFSNRLQNKIKYDVLKTEQDVYESVLLLCCMGKFSKEAVAGLLEDAIKAI